MASSERPRPFRTALGESYGYACAMVTLMQMRGVIGGSFTYGLAVGLRLAGIVASEGRREHG